MIRHLPSFTREAKALARLNHPGIVTLYEFGKVGNGLGNEVESAEQTLAASLSRRTGEGVRRMGEGSHYFFLMERVDGVNLRQLLHTGRVSSREALASMKHFLANEWDKSQRQKRGGNIPHFSLDWQTADTKFQVADANEPGPDQAFDREWAVALLDNVIERLRAECVAEGKAPLFEQLKIFLTVGKGEASHADAAQRMGLNETATRVAVHRLRKRYRQLLRDEIAQTLADAADVDEEMRALFGAFSA